jgi:hypothetical protein
VEQHLRPRDRELEALAAHLLDQDRQLELARPRTSYVSPDSVGRTSIETLPSVSRSAGLDLATRQQLALAAGERRRVDAERHPERRLVDVERGSGRGSAGSVSVSRS